MARTARDEYYQRDEPPIAENLPEGVIVSRDALRDERLPPGQVRTRKWPVLDASGTPRVDLSRWRLTIDGLTDRPCQLTWDQFRELPRVKVFADFHCVTRWSRLGNLWEGVSMQMLLNKCGVRPQARYAILHAADQGWTTNLPLDDLLRDDVLLADTLDGMPIPADHGGPVRAIVPHLYAWKSAKWICRIELTEENRRGYWESAGYHDRGDPWSEQRHREDA